MLEDVIVSFKSRFNSTRELTVIRRFVFGDGHGRPAGFFENKGPTRRKEANHGRC